MIDTLLTAGHASSATGDLPSTDIDSMAEGKVCQILVEGVLRALPEVAFAAVTLNESEFGVETARGYLRGAPLEAAELHEWHAGLDTAASALGAPVPSLMVERLARRVDLDRLLCLPLEDPTTRLGFVLVGRDSSRTFTGDEVRVLDGFCRHAALNLENFILRRRVARVERRRGEAEAMLAGVRDISAQSDLEGVLGSTVRHAKDLSGAQLAFLMLVDEQQNELHVRATVGARSDQLATARLSIEEAFAVTALRDRTPVCVSDILDGPRRSMRWELVRLAESVRSMLVAPLVAEARPIGLLFAANRHVTEFASEDGAALAELADIAAAAVGRARRSEHFLQSEKELRRRTEAEAQRCASATRQVELYDTLMEAALSVGGIRTLTAALARLLRCPVIVEDPLFRLLARATPDLQPVEDGLHEGIAAGALLDPEVATALRSVLQLRRPLRLPARPHLGLLTPRIIAPVFAGGATAGYVSALELTHPLDESGLLVLGQALSVFAMELRRQQDIIEAETRFAGDFLHDLLDNHRDGEIVERAQRLGLEMEELYAVGVVGIHAPSGRAETGQVRESESELEHLPVAMRDALRRLKNGPGPAPIAALRSDHVVVLWPGEVGPEAWRRLHQELSALRPGMRITIGTADPVRRAASARAAYRSALRTLRATLRLDRGGTVVHGRDLGVYRLLVGLSDHDELLAFARDVLGPLIGYDEAHRCELLRTLDAYLDSACHPQAAARALSVHPHTLRYRLTRIEELLGHRADDARWRQDAHVALAILRMEQPGALVPSAQDCPPPLGQQGQ